MNWTDTHFATTAETIDIEALLARFGEQNSSHALEQDEASPPLDTDALLLANPPGPTPTPEPVNPVPVLPVPVAPVPVEPIPLNPSPVEPAPTIPSAVEPAPTIPSPVDTVPVLPDHAPTESDFLIKPPPEISTKPVQGASSGGGGGGFSFDFGASHSSSSSFSSSSTTLSALGGGGIGGGVIGALGAGVAYGVRDALTGDKDSVRSPGSGASPQSPPDNDDLTPPPLPTTGPGRQDRPRSDATDPGSDIDDTPADNSGISMSPDERYRQSGILDTIRTAEEDIARAYLEIRNAVAQVNAQAAAAANGTGNPDAVKEAIFAATRAGAVASRLVEYAMGQIEDIPEEEADNVHARSLVEHVNRIMESVRNEFPALLESSRPPEDRGPGSPMQPFSPVSPGEASGPTGIVTELDAQLAHINERIATARASARMYEEMIPRSEAEIARGHDFIRKAQAQIDEANNSIVNQQDALAAGTVTEAQAAAAIDAAQWVIARVEKAIAGHRQSVAQYPGLIADYRTHIHEARVLIDQLEAELAAARGAAHDDASGSGPVHGPDDASGPGAGAGGQSSSHTTTTSGTGAGGQSSSHTTTSSGPALLNVVAHDASAEAQDLPGLRALLQTWPPHTTSEDHPPAGSGDAGAELVVTGSPSQASINPAV